MITFKPYNWRGGGGERGVIDFGHVDVWGIKKICKIRRGKIINK